MSGTDRKYWFALPVRPAELTRADIARFAYPVSWKGSALLLGTVLVPILLMLLAAPLMIALPDWAIYVALAVLVLAPVLGGILLIRSLTDPQRSIDDYRAEKKRIRDGLPPA
ncbi:MAG TPA: hypothetical protein VG942_04905 [Hyphomonadaceae bacterium]|nr:hypothetical protein [Hyphomonadaceae bacterium]